MRLLVTLLFGLVLAACPNSVSRAETPTLAVQEIFPPVVTAGQSTQVKIVSGRFTQDVDSLFFSHPGIQATLDTAPNLPFDDQPQSSFGSFQVTVSPDVPEGIYEVWAAGRYGVSNPRSIAVVHRPVMVLAETPNPNPLPRFKPGIVYVGRTLANARLNFGLETVSPSPRIAVIASQLESLALPAILVRDSEGRTLAQKRVHSESMLVLDRQDYRAHDSSDSLVYGLYDFLYRGGHGFAFAVEVEPDPSTAWFSAPDTKIAGLARRGLQDWPVAAGARSCETCPLTMPSPPWSTVVELGPGVARTALEFTPEENVPYECEVLSSSLQGATDLRAVIERIAVAEDKTTEEMVAVAEDTPTLGSRGARWISNDPLATIPPGPAAKKVRITLIDLLDTPSKRTGPKALVRVGPSIPRFHVAAHWTPDSNQGPQSQTTGACLRRGGQIGMHVFVRRAGGFTGPVTITLEGLPPGITSDPAIIAEGQTETELVLVADENAAAWTGPLRAIARGTINGSEVTQGVEPVAISMSASSDRGYPESRVTSQWILRVLEQETAPIQIRAGSGSIIEVQQGTNIPIPIRAIRRTGGEAKCILRPQNVPPKVAFGEFELAPGAAEANPEIKVAADAPAGEYTLWYVVEMTVKLPLHPESHSRWVAYRDRLQSRLADPSWNGDRAALEKTIAEVQGRAEALAKETAPRDFPTFFSAASFRVRILPAPPK
ncbi:MAG: hypothetical protein ACK5AC_12235 [Planctomycetota bacterium]|jgi:hypothetical protein